MRQHNRPPLGWMRRALLGLLLVPLVVGSPARPAAAQAPDLGAEALTYGLDQIPNMDNPDMRVRNFYSRNVGSDAAQQLTTLGNVWYQNWAPDARQIALVTEGLSLYTMQPDGSGLRPLANGVYSNPFWSPDGRFIAYLGGEAWTAAPLPRGDLWLIPQGGGPAWKVPGATAIPSLPAGVAWAPDGTRIAAGFPGRIFDVTEGGAAPVDLPGEGRGMWVLGGGWSPDGRYLAVTDGNRWGVLTLATGKFTTVATARGAPGTIKGGASWAAGPRRVVLSLSSPGADGHRVFAADFDGANPKLIWAVPHVANPRRGEISSIGPPGASPSGQQILIRVSRTTARGARLVYTHESWLLRLDGSDNHLLIPNSFNAVWRAKPRFVAADAAFFNTWRLADNPVATGLATRPWLWGAKPLTSMQEPWGAGTRLVEYYDKGRMQFADPAPARPSKSSVTGGFLAQELVSGAIQTGPASSTAQEAAAIPVVGDSAANPAPTYATFHALGTSTDAGRALDRTGTHVGTVLNRDGSTHEDAGLGNGVVNARYVPESGHNIPLVFWNWLQKQDNWTALTGYPISEPYWVRATVGGKPDQPVLVQIFTRRTLTFNFQLAPDLRVETGNVGQHYLAWRYGIR